MSSVQFIQTCIELRSDSSMWSIHPLFQKSDSTKRSPNRDSATERESDKQRQTNCATPLSTIRQRMQNEFESLVSLLIAHKGRLEKWELTLTEDSSGQHSQSPHGKLKPPYWNSIDIVLKYGGQEDHSSFTQFKTLILVSVMVATYRIEYQLTETETQWMATNHCTVVHAEASNYTDDWWSPKRIGELRQLFRNGAMRTISKTFIRRTSVCSAGRRVFERMTAVNIISHHWSPCPDLGMTFLAKCLELPDISCLCFLSSLLEKLVEFERKQENYHLNVKIV
jgi:hypothetical protein